MSNRIGQNKLYANGMKSTPYYLRQGFVFDYDKKPTEKVLIKNGETVKV